MTAIVDGITVIGTPEEINRLIEMRQKPESNLNESVKHTKSCPNSCCESH